MKRRYSLPTVSGLLTIVIYLTLSLVAYGYYPMAFSPRGNWLSDLGNRTLSPDGAVYYQTAAVLTGVMLALFFVALAAWFRQQQRKSRVFMGVALLFGLIGALALAMTGAFPEDRATPHSVFSAILYISFGTAVWFVGWAFLPVSGRRTLSYLCFAVVPATWAFSIFPHTYWLEWVVVFLLLLFVALVAVATSTSTRRLRAG
jgi:hypothetical protein